MQGDQDSRDNPASVDTFDVDIIEDDDIEILSDDEMASEAVEALDDDYLCLFNKHNGPIFCGSIDPSGEYAMTGGQDDLAYIWKLNSGEIVQKIDNFSDSVNEVSFSHDGLYAAAGCMSGTIQVWKIKDEPCQLSWSDKPDEDLQWLKWHEKAHVLMAGFSSGNTFLWKIPSGEFKLFAGSRDSCEYGVFLSDGKRAALGYDKGTVKIVDLQSTETLHSFDYLPFDQSPITCMASHPENTILAIGSSSGKVAVVTTSPSSYKVVSTFSGHEVVNSDPEVSNGFSDSFCEGVAFIHTENLQLLVAIFTYYIYLYDHSRQIVRHKLAFGYGFTRLTALPNEPFFLVASAQGSVLKIDARSARVVAWLQAHSKEIHDIAVSKNGKVMLSCSEDERATVFFVQNMNLTDGSAP